MADGSFQTTTLAAYPSQLCLLFASSIVSSFVATPVGSFAATQPSQGEVVSQSSPAQPPTGAGAAYIPPIRGPPLTGKDPLCDGDIYIGRGKRSMAVASSIWGNPFSWKADGRECLVKYKEHVLSSEELSVSLPNLAGARLRCHCPRRAPCHADVLIELFKRSLNEASGLDFQAIREERKKRAEMSTSDEDEDGACRAKLGSGRMGSGPPMSTRLAGRDRAFHDGCGLCSAGRWPPNLRPELREEGWARAVADLKALITGRLDHPRLLATLAAGKAAGEVFSAELLAAIRDILWVGATSSLGPTQGGPHDLPEGQPFYLRLISQVLRALGDPDWRFLRPDEGPLASGVNLGVDRELPRTPAVFERKTHFKAYPEGEDGVHTPHSKNNYGSTKGHLDAIEAQFAEEAEAGHMIEMSPEEATATYGSLPLVAALGAIEKGDDTFRIIHDGSHGVRVNHSIVPRDQVRVPSIAEMRTMLHYMRASGRKFFCLKGDVSKAHRRVKVRREDWRYQACQVRAGRIWLNKVGTFGIGSAAYWWARVAAAISRITIYLLGRADAWQLLFADDYFWACGGPTAIIDLLLCVAILAACGMPFSWGKFKGGFEVDWIGYWLDVGRFEAGISAARLEWACKALQDLLESKVVLIRRCVEVLGRLGFICNALEHYKPFLGPMYSWTSSHAPSAVYPLPEFVRLTLHFLLGRFKEGNRTIGPAAPRRECQELFRADAKASDDLVAVGGWECAGGTPPGEARWFSVQLTRKNSPWIFHKGEPFRLIATLELLATLLCVLVFDIRRDSADELSRITLGAGTTDNKGNMYLVRRLMTTKFPLSVYLMEIAAQMEKRGLDLELWWTPRDQNTEADELSNLDFRHFRGDRRIEVDLEAIQTIVMKDLLGPGAVEDLKASQRQAKRSLALCEAKRPRLADGIKERDPW